MSHVRYSIPVSKPNPGRRVAVALLSVISRLEPSMGPAPTVICVGSDRATGDSLGPLVGSMLTSSRFPGKVLGTLEQPVHAGNLEHALMLVDDTSPIILGVDACLGTQREVGTIIVSQGPLKPGLGVRKQLPPVGHLHIAGVVNVGGFMEHLVLQSTRLNLVVKMAQAIAWGIIHAVNHMEDSRPGATPGPRPLESDPIPPGLTTDGLPLQLLPVSGLQR
jgi:putative sporulation protein YyaC